MTTEEVVSVLKRMRCEVLSEETNVERNVIDAIHKVLREIGVREGEARLRIGDPSEELELADRVIDRLLAVQANLQELAERGMTVRDVELVVEKSLKAAEAYKRDAELQEFRTFKPPIRSGD